MKSVFFYLGRESLLRPAIRRHHEKVLNVNVDKDEITISSDFGIRADFYLKPAFGVIPAELLESYPAGHAEMPEDIDDEAYIMAVEGLKKFLERNKDKKVKLILDEKWKRFLDEG